MSATARAARRVVAAAFAVAMAVATASCSSGSSAAGAGDAAARALLRAPMDASLSTSGATWVEVPMGHVHQVANTFWQLVVLPAGAARWALVTPPGFADNGGLVSAQWGPTFVTGFNPSALIRFTPMSLSSNSGASWSQAVLNDELATVPDALAASGTGPVAALSGGQDAAVVSSSAGLSSWTTVVTRQALAATAAGRSCGVSALTALAYGPTGQLLVGASCSRAGEVGVFEDVAHSWRLVGPALPESGVGRTFDHSKVTTTVLRLRNVDGGVSALLAARDGARTVLLGTSMGDMAWSTPAGLALAPTGQLVSSAVAADGALDVVIDDNGHRVVDVLDAGSAAWTTLPAPPALTDVVALQPSGAVDALSVNGSRLSIFRLEPAASIWQQVQTVHVPIEYGSSS